MCGFILDFFYNNSWSLNHLFCALRLLKTQGESGASKVTLVPRAQSRNWSPGTRVVCLKQVGSDSASSPVQGGC